MATETVTGASSPHWQDTWEEIDTCIQQATGIVDLINQSGNAHQAAAWAAQDLLVRASKLHDELMQQVRDQLRSEAAHD